jgi:hypothetical protein
MVTAENSTFACPGGQSSFFPGMENPKPSSLYRDLYGNQAKMAIGDMTIFCGGMPSFRMA